MAALLALGGLVGHELGKVGRDGQVGVHLRSRFFSNRCHFSRRPTLAPGSVPVGC